MISPSSFALAKGEKTAIRFTKVQTGLHSVEMGEHIVTADRAACVGLKPGEDALAVVRMAASPETHGCALRQRLHAYAAVAVIQLNQVPTALKRRQVYDEPEIHSKGEVEVEPVNPQTGLMP